MAAENCFAENIVGRCPPFSDPVYFLHEVQFSAGIGPAHFLAETTRPLGPRLSAFSPYFYIPILFAKWQWELRIEILEEIKCGNNCETAVSELAVSVCHPPLRYSAPAFFPYNYNNKKAGLSARFSFVRVKVLFVVELELGEAVVNRVARALDAVILVIARLLDVECQRCPFLRF